MKIVFQNVIWLLAFAAYNYMTLAEGERDRKVVDIAAFFEEKDDESLLAFKTAVKKNNQMDQLMHYRARIVRNVTSETDPLEIHNTLCNLIKDGKVGAVIVPSNPKIAATIESLSTNMEIPTIQVDWRPYQEMLENQTTVVNFHPDQKLLFQGLGVIVRNLQWRSIVVFYETTEDLIGLQDILKIQNFDVNVKKNSVILKQLGSGPDYRSALKEIQNKTEYKLILACKTENIMEILSQAKDLGYLSKPFSIFITNLDAHTVNIASLNPLANITTVRIINPKSAPFQNALSRWQQVIEESYTSFNLDANTIKTKAAVMYDAINMYLKCVGDLQRANIEKQLEEIEGESLNCNDDIQTWKHGLQIADWIKMHYYDSETVHSISGPIKFDSFGRRIDFNIFVVEGDEDVAIWNPNKHNTLQFLKSEEDRNKELEKKWSEGILTVASILGPPYLMEKDKPKDGEPLQGNARYEGFSMDLIHALADELNIKFQFEVLKSGARGSLIKETNQWNGLIREVLDRRADLAICDLTITPERREAVDFSAPFMRLGISILYKKAEAKDANMYAFIDPFSFDLWMYSATLFLATSVALFFIARVSPPDWENPHPCDPEPEELENIWHLKNSLWLTMGSVMNQGCDILPKGLATRMTAAMWWFFTIIVTNSYMANLAAFLTNERSQGAINSAEDLAKQTKVKYGTLDGGSTQAFFRDSNYSIYQRMWTNMQQTKPSVFENQNSDGVARVQNTKNRGYAFLMESATLEYEIQTKCNLMQVGNWLDSKSYGIAMPLDYPHRSRINEALLNLIEKGKVNQLKEKWWKEKQQEKGKKLCSDNADAGTSASLALQNVGGVFLVLAVGVGLAYMVAIGEFLWNVRNVSVEEHMTFKEALIVELKFAFNFTVTKKRVKPPVSESSSSKSQESRSMARSILHGAGSFLHLDVLGKNDTPGSSRHSSRPLD